MIDLYTIALNHRELGSPSHWDWLSEAEQQRARQFHIPQLTQRYVVSHAALRLVLGRHTGRHPSEIYFQTNAWGRPEINGGPHFSLTHSDSIAVIAVSISVPIGVDVEDISTKIDIDILRGIMSTEEIRRLDSSDPQGDALLRLWTRKEAILKAFGRGLSYDARQLTVGFDPAKFNFWRHVALREGNKTLDFILTDVCISERVTAAVALSGRSTDAAVTVRSVEI
ncbi:4'-phosphopantetheinyl transferase superfamily protein [Rhizobium sp. ARZ01]|uniref:4'-phosphopantetheinyl transferase family protein n=1 Tax=Rhizobium sp. ARZ01 TaxID=2769313 RepID=UPI00177BF7AC|nr:4'-phosphopantetheinyl transferase superfamily protein [Rhizobium sp. ARZ01]MBD9374614.1 4'-phosphopantetheinyl transferase superfamily protein [Rhizobium sp. ARZ01]